MYGQVNSQSRSMGCVGFSTLLHAGLLAIAFILPSPKLLTQTPGDGAVQFTALSTDVKLGDQTKTVNTITQLTPQPAVADPSTPIAPSTPSTPSTIADPIIKSTPIAKKAKSHIVHVAKKIHPAVKRQVAKRSPKFNTDALDDEALAKALESDSTSELKKKPMADLPKDQPKPVAQTTQPPTPQTSAPAAAVATTATATAATAANAATAASSAYGLPTGVRDARFLKGLPGNPKPVYPQDDRMAERQGLVRVIYTVTPAGRISEIRVVKNTGSSEMLDNTIDALKQYRFYPQQAGLWQQDFRFQLSGAPTEIAGAIHQ